MLSQAPAAGDHHQQALITALQQPTSAQSDEILQGPSPITIMKDRGRVIFLLEESDLTLPTDKQPQTHELIEFILNKEEISRLTAEQVEDMGGIQNTGNGEDALDRPGLIYIGSGELPTTNDTITAPDVELKQFAIETQHEREEELARLKAEQAMDNQASISPEIIEANGKTVDLANFDNVSGFEGEDGELYADGDHRVSYENHSLLEDQPYQETLAFGGYERDESDEY